MLADNEAIGINEMKERRKENVQEIYSEESREGKDTLREQMSIVMSRL